MYICVCVYGLSAALPMQQVLLDAEEALLSAADEAITAG